MKVEKRDGKQVNFDEQKIYKAILSASKSVKEDKRLSEDDAKKVLEFVLKQLKKENKELVNIELIQNFVENGLQHYNFYEVAKAYILYRNDAEKERFKKLEIVKEIKEKLEASKVQNQNANLDESSFGGRKGEADSVLLKQMALDYYISPKFAKNHNENRVYIHDLDSYVIGMHNCLTIPFKELLENGFTTRQVDIRPASSINTAFQLIAVIFQLQSLQQFGGVSAGYIDNLMIPYFRKSFMKHFKDGLKYAEGKSDKKIEKIVEKILED